ncbi:MAG TPA: phosphoglycerate kinase [Candidatus Paceibacterota bacterium]|nr:phosphoglycerate kinase [Candidatus Paceibacterota bacterium]
MQVTSIRDADVSGKRVLVRVDFNVPMKDGQVVDDARIKAALPTIGFLHERGAAQIILLAHLGRPDGKVVEDLRLAPIEARARALINAPFEMHENLRFDAREEANDEGFAKELAGLGDIFVNEAFADSHRAHASIVGIPKFLPSYAGLRFEEEVTKLSAALTPPPGAVAIIGGAKIETKAPLIEKFAATYSLILVGGAIANEYTAKTNNVMLPQDGVSDATHVADIGPETARAWTEIIAQAPFVVWNGTMGMYEQSAFIGGTDAIAKAIIGSRAVAIIGGGDTAAAVAKFAFDPARIFISTGGGAMLEFLIQGTLPGIEALKR